MIQVHERDLSSSLNRRRHFNNKMNSCQAKYAAFFINMFLKKKHFCQKNVTDLKVKPNKRLDSSFTI